VKVLILGNSQAGALKRSHDRRRADLAAAGVALHFYVIPGGMGPDVGVAQGRMVLGETSPTHPPYVAPAGTEAMPLDAFDAILISALGYADGGHAAKNPITVTGVMAEYGPRGAGLERPLVSDTCFRAMAEALFDRQPGFAACRALAAAFAGPLFVQPFPRPGAALAAHPGWGLAQWYDDPLGVHGLLEDIKDRTLARLVAETGVQLLDYPPGAGGAFTPDALMNPRDDIHQADAYGDLVLDQLVARCRARMAGASAGAYGGASAVGGAAGSAA
jgi:hypothetical protein